MNRPILFIDEAPFVQHHRRTGDFEKFRELRFRLQDSGLQEEVEFFYDDGLQRGGMPKDLDGNEFKSLIADRKFIFGHNSYPEAGSGEVPLLEESFFYKLRIQTERECVLVRFSGSRRGKFSFVPHSSEIDESWDNPLNYKEIHVGRHEVYACLDRFVENLKRNSYRMPIYELLTKEHWSLRDTGDEYIRKINEFLLEEVASISGVLNRGNNQQPKKNWKDLIGSDPTLFFLSIFPADEAWKSRVLARLEEKKGAYLVPVDFLNDLELLLNKFNPKP
jgi:hypothetical protein